MKLNFNEISKLVEEVKQGKSDSFTTLYEQTYQRIHFLAYSILKNEHDAQDAVQDVYIKIIDKLDTLEDSKLFIAWANKITYNICIRRLSMKSVDIIDIDNIDYVIGESDELNPIILISKYEKKQVLASLIDSLDPVLRATIILRFYENLKLSQIAEIMDCPEGTVKSRLNTAKKQLKNKILYERKGEVLFSAFTFLPIRDALSYSAQSTVMDSSAAYDVLLGALSKNGMSTAVNFTPSSPSQSYSGHKTTSSIIAAGGIAALACASLALSSPTITSVEILNNTHQFTKDNIIISVHADKSIVGISDVYAIDNDSNKFYPVIKVDNEYIFNIGRNGLYEFYTHSNNGKIDSVELEINYIDTDFPFIKNYVYTADTVSITVEDDLSGIDFNSIYGEDDSGNIIMPLKVNEEENLVIFSFSNKSFSLFVSDYAGNIAKNRVNILKK